MQAYVKMYIGKIIAFIAGTDETYTAAAFRVIGRPTDGRKKALLADDNDGDEDYEEERRYSQVTRYGGPDPLLREIPSMMLRDDASM